VRPPVVAVSGPSGSGKTRLLKALIPALALRGVAVALLKHTSHRHPFDQPGKDTEVLRRAGAVAALIQGPDALALHAPPRDLDGLLALLPPCDLVLAEGWRGAPLARVEVHRRCISDGFLCATDRRVFAVVSDVRPPRDLPWLRASQAEALADLLVEAFGLRGRRQRPARTARVARPRRGGASRL